jgi:signal transduction histidine kinase
MWATQGIASPIVITLPVVVFYVLVVLGLRWALAWTAILSVIILGFYYLRDNGGLPPHQLSVEGFKTYRLVSYVTGSILFVVLYTVYQKVFLTLKEILSSQRQESAQILQIISHDLRSPLQIIQSYGQLITDTQSKEKTNEYVEIIQKALDRITLVLDQVRNYEMAMGGRKLFEMKSVDLVESIDDVLEALRPQFTAKKIKVDFHPQENESFFVMGDKVAITEQVLANFLINAFKFSMENGAVRINLTKGKKDVTVEISDKGVGMSPETLGSIFNFRKATTRPGTAGEKGSGFGMPIAKIFLDQMQAHVKIESRDVEESPQDHGTKVTLVFKAAT